MFFKRSETEFFFNTIDRWQRQHRMRGMKKTKGKQCHRENGNAEFKYVTQINRIDIPG